MIKSLRIKNLKAWGEQLWGDGVQLAPITLMLGANSAGKTSILQLPLLLKQTFLSSDRRLDLNLGGQADDLVDLGSFEDLIHSHNSKLELGIGMTVVAAPSDDVASSKTDVEEEIVYEATFRAIREAPTIQALTISRGSDSYSATRQRRGGYELKAPEYVAKLLNKRTDARRTFQPERSLMFSQDAIVELGEAGDGVQDLSLRLRRAIERIVYLGPLREPPGRSYQWTGQEHFDLGKRGERSVHALLASANERKKVRGEVEGGPAWLVDKVSVWLKKLGVADKLVLERQGKSRHYELVVVRRGKRANIMDVGFGISQVIPMLVLAYFVPRGSTIVAEEPEIHLHPRAQVGLAELMVEVARERSVQFLVETHSEHLFRRLQTLVAEEVVPATDCALYFVDADEEGRAELRRLELDGYGRIANWPKQFFGDAIGETERQTRRMIERMAKQRGGGK